MASWDTLQCYMLGLSVLRVCVSVCAKQLTPSTMIHQSDVKLVWAGH